jgi:hypothetical protein
VRDKATQCTEAQHVTDRGAAVLATMEALATEKVVAVRAPADSLARELCAGVHDVYSLVASTDATLRPIDAAERDERRANGGGDDQRRGMAGPLRLAARIRPRDRGDT